MFFWFSLFCVIFYNLKENVAKKVGNFRNNDLLSFGNIWTLEEFNKFINSVDDIEYRTLFELLFFTGLRKGEALALCWNDIDFLLNSINVYKTLSKSVINGVHPITPPKQRIQIELF
ncbi:MAG: tyrosine-type recombinase/integrase [Bacilli bacterium]|nr:tyrosine-type recombinase/integrase [Bacilli bacterium]